MSKFKVGDRVEILPLTNEEKRRYPPSWMNSMDQYIGLVTEVTRVFDNGRYKLNNTNDWTWHEMHLTLANTFDAF